MKIKSKKFIVASEVEWESVGEGVTRKMLGFYIPPHADHGAVCLEAGELIDVFSPHREEFI